MSDIEKLLQQAGATLIKHKKHKIYEINGRRFTISHGNNNRANNRDRHKPMIHFLKKLLDVRS